MDVPFPWVCACVLRRTGYGALVALDERLSRHELVKDGHGQRARATHGGDGHLLLKGQWHRHECGVIDVKRIRDNEARHSCAEQKKKVFIMLIQ